MSILNGKRPMNLTMRGVSSIFPSDDFKIKCPFVRDTSFQALLGQNTQLDFCHIEPRPMRWGEMKTQTTSDAVSLGFAKRFEQSVIGMGVEIIQHEINAIGIRVEGINQITHSIGEIPFGALAGDEGMAFTGFRFSKHEQVTSAVTLIFVVFPTGMPRTDRQGDTGMLEQLKTLLIETNHGVQWVIGLMIQTQHAFHSRQKHGSYVGDAPAFDLPRLNLFFFRMSRTVSGAICSITPSSTSRWASNSSVQRARPSGGSVHANAVRCASWPSSSFTLLPRPCLSVKGLSRPSSQNRKRVRRTVSSSMYNWSQISRSVLPSSLFNKMCARRITTAWLRPLLTIANNFCRSLGVSLISCFSILSAYPYPSSLAS